MKERERSRWASREQQRGSEALRRRRLHADHQEDDSACSDDDGAGGDGALVSAKGAPRLLPLLANTHLLFLGTVDSFLTSIIFI